MDGNNMNNVNETANTVETTTSTYDAYSYDTASTGTTNASGGNGMAIAALICGIASIVCCAFGCLPIGAGIAGIILGINGQKKCENAGMAKIGMILGIVGIVISIIVLIISFATGLIAPTVDAILQEL